MSERTWKIRSQVGVDKRGNVVWGPEREVTLEEYLAEHRAACERAKALHAANVAALSE